MEGEEGGSGGGRDKCGSRRGRRGGRIVKKGVVPYAVTYPVSQQGRVS